MKTVYHLPLDFDHAPKRGDLLQSNIGKRTERTWLILGVKAMAGAKSPDGRMSKRFRLWAERWWELETEMRMALFRSAERSGGQNYWPFYRYPAKKKKKTTFEDYVAGRRQR